MTYKKKLSVLSVLVAVLVLVFAGTIVFDAENVNARDAAFAWLDAKSEDKVAALEITKGSETINLVKAGTEWFVDNKDTRYPAKETRIKDLLGLLSKKSAYPVRGREAASFENLGLIEGSAERLTLKDQRGVVLLDLLVGKTGAGGEVYLRKNGVNEARAGSDSFSTYVAGSRISWYKLRLFPETEKLSVDLVQAVEVKPLPTTPAEGEEPTVPVSFKLARSEGGWTLDGAPVDATKVESYVRGILDAEGEDFATEPFDNNSVAGSIVLQLGNGTDRTLRAGPIRETNRRNIGVSGSEYVFVLSKWTLDRLFKDADSFK